MYLPRLLEILGPSMVTVYKAALAGKRIVSHFIPIEHSSLMGRGSYCTLLRPYFPLEPLRGVSGPCPYHPPVPWTA